MLIREYPGANAAELGRHVSDCGPDAEPYVRHDGTGGLVLCASAAPPAAPVERTAKVLFTGGQFGKDGGDWLFFVGLWTPEDFRNEFLAWYKIEHMPILLECRTWDGCRFVEEKVDNGCQFHAMHQLSDRAGLDSVERKISRSTPWFRRLAQHSWFDGAFQRSLYKRVPA